MLICHLTAFVDIQAHYIGAITLSCTVSARLQPFFHGSGRAHSLHKAAHPCSRHQLWIWQPNLIPESSLFWVFFFFLSLLLALWLTFFLRRFKSMGRCWLKALCSSKSCKAAVGVWLPTLKGMSMDLMPGWWYHQSLLQQRG